MVGAKILAASEGEQPLRQIGCVLAALRAFFHRTPEVAGSAPVCAVAAAAAPSPDCR